MHHVDAPERVTRAVGVYEWTGDLNQPTAARFVPVSLFINGAMEDAGLYLARPVPFALQTGDLYALERSGEPQGLLDLDYAQRAVANQAVQDDGSVLAWYGFGKFTPQAPPKIATLHPSARLPVIQSDGKATASADDGRPHMSRRGDSTAPASTGGGGAAKDPAAKPDAGDASKTNGTGESSSGTGSPASGSPGSGSTTASSDDTDRPTLRHRDPSQDATRKREYGPKSKQASVTSVGPGPGDDPDRPVLGRNTEADTGTPPLTGLPADMHQVVGVSDPAHRDAHNFAREWDTPSERTLTLSSLEAVARPRVMAYLAKNSLVPSSAPLPPEGASAAAASVAGATPKPASAPAAATAEGAQNSDEAGSPPKLERGVPSQYQPSGTAPKTAPAKPAPAPPALPVAAPTASTAPPARTPARRTPSATNHALTHHTSTTAAPSTATLILGQSSLTAYTLSYGGLPTFVYTAAASVTQSKPTQARPASSKPAATASTMGSRVPAPPSAGTSAHPAVFVTLVAQRLPSGELQVVLTSITDSLHLDRSPRLRLVDAVDPDDSHRASLLFELRGASSRQFALYRLTAAQAEQTFTTASIE